MFEARAQVQQGFGPSLGDLSPLRLQLLGADATQAPYLEPRPLGISYCPPDMPTRVTSHVSQTVYVMRNSGSPLPSLPAASQLSRLQQLRSGTSGCPPLDLPAHPVVPVLIEHPESDHLSPASPPWHWLPPLMAWMPARAQTRLPASLPPSAPHGRPCPSRLAPITLPCHPCSPPPTTTTPSLLLDPQAHTPQHPSFGSGCSSTWSALPDMATRLPLTSNVLSSKTVSLSRCGEPTALTPLLYHTVLTAVPPNTCSPN